MYKRTKYLIVFLTIVLLVYICTRSSEKKLPHVSEKTPNFCASMYYHSDFQVAQAGNNLYFVSGSENTLYYIFKNRKKYQIEKTQFKHISDVTQFESILYILDSFNTLTLYNSKNNQIISQISLNQIVDRGSRIFSLSCTDESGVYLQGIYSFSSKEGQSLIKNYTLFVKVSIQGEISILKEISEENRARLALVHENILYYDYENKNGDSKVLACDMDTNIETTISTKRGNGIDDFHTKYYIWNENLVFPVESEGICIAKLNGSQEYVNKFPVDNSITKVDNYIYSSGPKLEKINLENGQITKYTNKKGYYKGTLSTYDNKLILLRNEGKPIGGTRSEEKALYIFPAP